MDVRISISDAVRSTATLPLRRVPIENWNLHAGRSIGSSSDQRTQTRRKSDATARCPVFYPQKGAVCRFTHYLAMQSTTFVPWTYQK